MAVEQGVPAVADWHDGDRREDRAAVLGQPDPLPAPARRLGHWAKGAVELLGAGRLERARDRVERDLLEPARAGGAGPAGSVMDRQVTGCLAEAQRSGHGGAAACAARPGEGVLGVEDA